MLRDFGSRDGVFIDLTAELRQRLLAVANGMESHVTVPLQGSGSFIVEATIATLVGPDDKLLVPVNGAYGGSRPRWAGVAPPSAGA
jgi:2-aminoethylphosphonate-pyruvate transaminase